MRIHRSFAPLLVAGICLAACGDDDAGSQPPPGEIVRSSKARIVEHGVASETVRALARDDAEAAFAMLHAEQPDGNFFYSPHSISIALAMTYAGARGETERQMAEALRFRMPQAELHPAFNALDQELATRERTATERGGEPFRLRVVNSIWGQRGYRFLDAYLDVLAESYGAGLSLLDFVADPEGSRQTINAWVSDQTETRIPELIPMGVIDSTTVLVLTNAIYFKASWDQPFDPADTADDTFHALDGSSLTVPLMHDAAEHRYAEDAQGGWQAVELTYSGEQVSMLVVLPADGTFETFERTLDEPLLTTIVDGLATRRVDLTLPKFSFRSQLSLVETLREMGMLDAFSGDADLSGMDGTRQLFIQDVIHEAFVAVDERGTEAAAATAVVVGRTSAPEPATFTADRPFLFVIRDIPTGAVLFVGRVVSP